MSLARVAGGGKQKARKDERVSAMRKGPKVKDHMLTLLFSLNPFPFSPLALLYSVSWGLP